MPCEVTHDRKKWSAIAIVGATPAYLAVRDWAKLKDGVAFSEADLRNRALVCLLGQTVHRELFGSSASIGKRLQIKGSSFRVIGTLAEKGCDWRRAEKRCQSRAGCGPRG
jgi:putative ABC transport system permease protein